MTPSNLGKGYLAEEIIRRYFLDTGAYVLRGVNISFKGEMVTDVDLWLYIKSSTFTRTRINVDIKDKKTAKAIERIFWAEALQNIYGFDKAIVVTSDNRDIIDEFARNSGVSIIDGSSLLILKEKYTSDTTRINEEDLDQKISADFKRIKQESKERTLVDFNFDTVNFLLESIRKIIERVIVSSPSNQWNCRLLFLEISLLLICIDYLLVSHSLKFPFSRIKSTFENGIKFGESGSDVLDYVRINFHRVEGINKRIGEIEESLDDVNYKILSEFYLRNEIQSDLFRVARAFETLCFSREFANPDKIESILKTHLAILLDFHKVNRKKFFDSFSSWPA